MQQFDYDEMLDLLLAKDDRYPRAAYHFVREGLDYTQHKMSKMSSKICNFEVSEALQFNFHPRKSVLFTTNLIFHR